MRIQPRRRPRLNDGVRSGLPALGELSIVYLNNVTIARREQPTVEFETSARGFARDIRGCFLCYPVWQASDITPSRQHLEGVVLAC